MAHAGGRPPMYKSADEMQKVIDKYFKDCEGKPLLDDEGKVMLDKYDKPIIVGQKPPTVTGLALALGFTSRLALLNYQDKDEFFNTVTRAKARCEEYAESRLFDKDGANGAKFSLANNFRDWAEKTDTTIRNPDGESFKIESIADAEKIIAEYQAKNKGI